MSYIGIKTSEKTLLVILLMLSILFFIYSVISFALELKYAASCAQTASGLFAIAALVQLHLVDFFETSIQPFFDEARYPFGPPSAITRHMIDNPDTPTINNIKSFVIWSPKFGFSLGIISAVCGIWSAWI